MAKGGRQPTPNSLKLLTRPAGNAVKDRSQAHRATGGVPVDEQTLDGDIPQAPEGLRGGTIGRYYWRHYWRSATWLTRADIPLVGRLCLLWNIAQRLMDGIESDSLYDAPEPGKRATAHPLLLDYDRVIGRIERIEDRLGLNPVERSRIRIQVKERKTALDAWRENRGDSAAADG